MHRLLRNWIRQFVEGALQLALTASWFATSRLTAAMSNRRAHDDRGSIGEWVMILVMAVGIVLFIWSIAQPMLGQILRNALSKLFR